MAAQLTRDGFDASAYPRTYRASPGWMLFLVLCGVLLGLGSIAGLGCLVFFLLHGQDMPVWAASLLGVGLVALAGVGSYSALSALMSRVVLTADGVVLLEPFKQRQLACREIRGFRTIRNQRTGSTPIGTELLVAGFAGLGD